jgi:hypothetical protein
MSDTATTASRWPYQGDGNAFDPIKLPGSTDLDWLKVSVRTKSSTDFSEVHESDSAPIKSQKKEVDFVPPKVPVHYVDDIGAAVIQLWEGCVLAVDDENEVMNVSLRAKIGQIPEHTAEIELQWVSEQDRDLVVPGAIFYLTLYKRTRHGSVENSQELRFRRRPSWTKQQVQDIYSDAENMLKKISAHPAAL